jgi:type VI secretion system protein
MAVTLRLSGGATPGTSQTKLLSKGTLSIGRGAGNDWVLADPDRHLSKTHCILSVENGRVVLTDVSTNGVHINGARQATARDSRTILTDGDDFRLGDYTITVAETADAGVGRGGAATIDPFDAPIGPSEGGSPLDIDPLDDPLGRPPDPSFQHHMPYRAGGPARPDPFDVAEERSSRAPDPDDDLFRGTKPTQEWQGPTQSDHADAPKHAFTAPHVLPATTDPNAIDFDALIGDIGVPSPPPPPPPQRVAPPAMRDPFADPGAPTTAPPARDPFADAAEFRPAPPPPPSIVPLGRDPFADPGGLLGSSPPPSVVPAPPPPQPPPPPPPPRAPVPDPVAQEHPFEEPSRPAPPVAAPVAASPATGDARAVLQAFLEGAGVPGSVVANADPAVTMRLVGQVFRAMTEGLREVLLSRAAIKSDMRVEQTMIRASNNNGLKFSVNVDDAVAALLSPERPGYMPPLAATKEAFNDIKAHELAVMAGVQTALLNLLQRFDPEALEKRLVQGRLASVLPGSRKARYWDSFTELYKDIARESEDDFQAVFGRDFAKAYTAQNRKGE